MQEKIRSDYIAEEACACNEIDTSNWQMTAEKSMHEKKCTGLVNPPPLNYTDTTFACGHSYSKRQRRAASAACVAEVAHACPRPRARCLPSAVDGRPGGNATAATLDPSRVPARNVWRWLLATGGTRTGMQDPLEEVFASVLAPHASTLAAYLDLARA